MTVRFLLKESYQYFYYGQHRNNIWALCVKLDLDNQNHCRWIDDKFAFVYRQSAFSD